MAAVGSRTIAGGVITGSVILIDIGLQGIGAPRGLMIGTGVLGLLMWVIYAKWVIVDEAEISDELAAAAEEQFQKLMPEEREALKRLSVLGKSKDPNVAAIASKTEFAHGTFTGHFEINETFRPWLHQRFSPPRVSPRAASSVLGSLLAIYIGVVGYWWWQRPPINPPTGSVSPAPTVIAPKEPFLVHVSTPFTGDDWRSSCGFWVLMPGPSLMAVNAGAYVRIRNLQAIPATIEFITVEAQDHEGRWTRLFRLDTSRGGDMYFATTEEAKKSAQIRRRVSG